MLGSLAYITIVKESFLGFINLDFRWNLSRMVGITKQGGAKLEKICFKEEFKEAFAAAFKFKDRISLVEDFSFLKANLIQNFVSLLL